MSLTQVYYNGQRLAVKNFQDYVNLYLGPADNGIARVFEKVGDRWEICISPTDGQSQQVRDPCCMAMPTAHLQGVKIAHPKCTTLATQHDEHWCSRQLPGLCDTHCLRCRGVFCTMMHSGLTAVHTASVRR